MGGVIQNRGAGGGRKTGQRAASPNLGFLPSNPTWAGAQLGPSLAKAMPSLESDYESGGGSSTSRGTRGRRVLNVLVFPSGKGHCNDLPFL